MKRVGSATHQGVAEAATLPASGCASPERLHVPLRAYALLDVVLAVTLFAITVTGLLMVLRGIGDTSSGFARDRYIQQQLEGLLAEKRRVGLDAMASETLDELSGITFRTYVEPFEIDNGEGDALTDLYKLTAEAAFTDDGGEQLEKAELVLYVQEQQ
jgi:hypothetical protein